MDSTDGGLTVLEAVILGVVALLLAAVAIHAAAGPAAAPGGLIPLVLGETGDCLVLDGNVYGYALADGSIGGADLRCDRPDPSAMGSLACSVRLFIGDMGSIDMGRATVEVATRERVERLGMTTEMPVLPGNWTIVRKGHTVPFQEADDDLLLEPGERFDLLVYPSRPLARGEAFRLCITPPGSVPLVVERTVPPRITPVVDLG
ncbi:hypothetical protein F8E02_05535 [Methanoculleus sp. Wushi-C6]|uniref:Type II secretion system protein n=1 Tax=Methanoculleus caldifontis TaxID=2651577 RepID=A0ABU3X096_9EURY|nr:hypothetical protein [Methanoculleus sp. Wushi-C6]MDV2481474.1 hypothetical protein [Methanoculleus sp. Wushi-C6]